MRERQLPGAWASRDSVGVSGFGKLSEEVLEVCAQEDSRHHVLDFIFLRRLFRTGEGGRED